MEQCPCEKDVAVLKDKVDKVVKQLEGNGQEGFITRYVKTEQKVDKMEESLDKLATSFSALAKNDSNREAVRKVLGGALIKTSLIVGIFGTVITLIFKLV